MSAKPGAIHLPDILEDAENELPSEMRDLITMLNERIQSITENVDLLELKIRLSNKQIEQIKRLDRDSGDWAFNGKRFCRDDWKCRCV